MEPIYIFKPDNFRTPDQEELEKLNEKLNDEIYENEFSQNYVMIETEDGVMYAEHFEDESDDVEMFEYKQLAQIKLDENGEPELDEDGDLITIIVNPFTNDESGTDFVPIYDGNYECLVTGRKFMVVNHPQG